MSRGIQFARIAAVLLLSFCSYWALRLAWADRLSLSRSLPGRRRAFALAIARAMLQDVMTESAYERIRALGERLADGLDRLFRERALPWRAFRCGPRSGYCLSPSLPRTGAEGYQSLDYELIDARRGFMANRGIWDAVAAAGSCRK